ncbi:MAG TPA: hypothetical protein DDW34_09100 [Clostridium sp.]|nr:hypothetical protein [Clostridium sp.]
MIFVSLKNIKKNKFYLWEGNVWHYKADVPFCCNRSKENFLKSCQNNHTIVKWIGKMGTIHIGRIVLIG